MIIIIYFGKLILITENIQIQFNKSIDLFISSSKTFLLRNTEKFTKIKAPNFKYFLLIVNLFEKKMIKKQIRYFIKLFENIYEGSFNFNK
jgi:hypothetical protein